MKLVKDRARHMYHYAVKKQEAGRRLFIGINWRNANEKAFAYGVVKNLWKFSLFYVTLYKKGMGNHVQKNCTKIKR